MKTVLRMTDRVHLDAAMLRTIVSDLPIRRKCSILWTPTTTAQFRVTSSARFTPSTAHHSVPKETGLADPMECVDRMTYKDRRLLKKMARWDKGVISLARRLAVKAIARDIPRMTEYERR